MKDLTEAVRKKLKVELGVEVTDVESNGSAQEAGIARGDIITMIDNQAVTSVKDFEQITGDLKSGKSVHALFGEILYGKTYDEILSSKDSVENL